ncbi:hypothetical protein [Tenacibaculum sp. SG-28]|uniref:hypothetical protein n=1 Tax=Tenacibaculum sp. SG-28 TaxID=754426 RepID=UPI000CF3C1BD|nr:hypothetical protein [Tenacibaculum sp. SG-28]
MKTPTKQFVMAIGLALLSVNFTSCKNEKENTGKHEANNSVKKVVKPIVKEVHKPIVFITGHDRDATTFYSDATEYFTNKNYKIVQGVYSLEEMLTWLNNNAYHKTYGEIHIVNNNSPWLGMDLETRINGTRVNSTSLEKCLDNEKLPVLENHFNANSKIIFHSNALAEDTKLIQALQRVFTTENNAEIIASPYFNVFGGEFSAHYLAKPYYVFYPTAKSPGKVDLSKEIAKKYPEEEFEWYDALNNERERYVGEPYTIQQNIPIVFEIDYHNSDDEIPDFTSSEEIMQWVINDEDMTQKVKSLNIPIEKLDGVIR